MYLNQKNIPNIINCILRFWINQKFKLKEKYPRPEKHVLLLARWFKTQFDWSKVCPNYKVFPLYTYSMLDRWLVFIKKYACQVDCPYSTVCLKVDCLYLIIYLTSGLCIFKDMPDRWIVFILDKWFISQVNKINFFFCPETKQLVSI